MAAQAPAPVTGTRRPRLIGDGVAALLLVAGLLLPWNIHVGVGIAETPGPVLAALIVVTLLSLGALIASAAGRRRGTDPVVLAKLRLGLNVPYLVLVVAFVVFATAIAIRDGGTGVVAPGVGPGAWSGVAGAVLAAQPLVVPGDGWRYGARACRVIGWLSIVLAVLAALFNLYFRTRFVLPGIGGNATAPNLMTAVTAVLYAGVAVLPALIAGRWLIAGKPAQRLATVLLGSSSVLAAAVVWVLPVGRDLDYFRGIAQVTGTADIGYEGYLAWSAAAAIVGTFTVRRALAVDGSELWRGAARSCLLLIAVWCTGKAVLRIAGVGLASVLGLPDLPYVSTVLMALEVGTAVLALWMLVNAGGRIMSGVVAELLFGVLFVLTVCRLVLGVALMPRVHSLTAGTVNDVFGNDLAQQITTTFDVALAVLALGLLAGISASGYRSRQRVSARPVGKTTAPDLAGADRPRSTTTGQPGPKPAQPSRAWAPPPDAHSAPSPARPQPDRVAEVLAQSAQRFGAGTIYGAPTPDKPDPRPQS